MKIAERESRVTFILEYKSCDTLIFYKYGNFIIYFFLPLYKIISFQIYCHNAMIQFLFFL